MMYAPHITRLFKRGTIWRLLTSSILWAHMHYMHRDRVSYDGVYKVTSVATQSGMIEVNAVDTGCVRVNTRCSS